MANFNTKIILKFKPNLSYLRFKSMVNDLRDLLELIPEYSHYEAEPIVKRFINNLRAMFKIES